MNAFQEWKLRRLKLMKTLWLAKLCMKLHLPMRWLANHWIAQQEYEHEYKAKLRGMARITLGYENALECPGRDTEEFFTQVWDSLGESIQFWQGTVSPRLHRIICLNNPSMFPLDNLKYRVILRLCRWVAIATEWAVPAALLASVVLNIYMVNLCLESH